MKRYFILCMILMSLSQVVVAKKLSQDVLSDTMKLIDIAGKQRMLSQRIVKDYLYIGNKVATFKAKKQLKKALAELKNSHKVLVESINDPEIKNLLLFVEMSTEDFEATSKETYTLDNAKLILDLGESMLEGSQYVVDSLKNSVKTNDSKIVDVAGRQRMLSQRIAKYYIAYQSGIRDTNTIEQMQDSITLFSSTHKQLMQNPDNTPEINRNLKRVDRLWKIVYKFYLNIEKGGLPLIVFNTTDTIMKKMNIITGLYTKLF